MTKQYYTMAWLASPRQGMFLAGAVAALSVGLILLAPAWASRFFQGPEGTRWVVPLISVLGIALTGFTLAAPHLYQRYKSQGSVLAWGAVTILGSLIAFIALQRLFSGTYPLESWNTAMAIRLSQGGSLYPDPETAPGGTIYAPLLFLLSSIFFKILPGYWPYGRIISLISIALTACYVNKITDSQCRNKAAGLWGVVIFLGTYGVMDKLYDQAIVDPLLMCLISGGLYHFLKNTAKGDFTAFLFVCLAGFTKQNAALPFTIVLVSAVMARRRAWVYTPVLVAGLGFIGMLFLTDGWAWTYLVTYPGMHAFRNFPPLELLFKLFFLQAPLWAGMMLIQVKEKNWRFLAFGTAVLCSSLMGIWKTGGWIGSLFPLEAVLCAGAAGWLIRWKWLLAVQLLIGAYNPFGTLYPWSAFRSVNSRAVELAKSVKGDVWLPTNSHLAFRSGKKEWEHYMALSVRDLETGQLPAGRIIEAIKSQVFSLIIIPARNLFNFQRSTHPKIHALLQEHYIRMETDELVVFKPKK